MLVRKTNRAVGSAVTNHTLPSALHHAIRAPEVVPTELWRDHRPGRTLAPDMSGLPPSPRSALRIAELALPPGIGFDGSRGHPLGHSEDLGFLLVNAAAGYCRDTMLLDCSLGVPISSFVSLAVERCEHLAIAEEALPDIGSSCVSRHPRDICRRATSQR